MSAEQQGEGPEGEEERVPAAAGIVAAGHGVEDERQERRRVGQRPAQPEEEEAAESEGERAGERGDLLQPLPAHPEEAEDQRQEHPQRRHHPGGPRQGERIPQQHQRLQGLRLGIGEERHARPRLPVPERPAPLRPGAADGGERRGDELDQVPLEEIALRLGGLDPLEGDLAAKSVERQQDAAATEDRTEEDQQRHGEDAEHPRRNRVIPPPQRPGERRSERPDPEGGQQVHRTPVGHGRAV